MARSHCSLPLFGETKFAAECLGVVTEIEGAVSGEPSGETMAKGLDRLEGSQRFTR